MVTVHSAAIFVFVGVDSNYFRYVRDVEVIVQCLVGEITKCGREECILRVWALNRAMEAQLPSPLVFLEPL